jgi:hypothetical protein
MAFTSGRFALWWLGGFGLVGAIVAPLTIAVVLKGEPTLVLFAIAILGVIVGILLGLSIARAIVLVADGLGWSENPRFHRLGRLVQRLDNLLDEAGP